MVTFKVLNIFFQVSLHAMNNKVDKIFIISSRKTHWLVDWYLPTLINNRGKRQNVQICCNMLSMPMQDQAFKCPIPKESLL